MLPDMIIDVNRLGGTAEVAALLECPKQQIHALRRNPKFPTPIVNLAATPVWDLTDIAEFKSSWQRRPKSPVTQTPEV